MSDVSSALVDLQLFALVGGLALAAGWDARAREVPDRLWQVVAGVGALLGALLLAGQGPGVVLLWLFVAGFALQHLFSWEEHWEAASPRLLGLVDAVLYVGTGAVLLAAAWEYGVGGGGVPLSIVAVYVTVLTARGLFEARILYGGADAKAVIVVAVVLPLWATPLLVGSPTLTPILEVIPFALTVLVNAAVLTLLVPIALAIRNARRGELSFPKGFLGMSIPTDELPARYVWAHDPSLDQDHPPDDVATSAEDRQLRVRQAAELRARGVERVWVSPQVPMVLFLALGAGLGLLVGNLVLDLVAIL
ncbi:MAG: hypothetical protein ABSA15_00220 [Thermoplasmata archaeon]|jgi:prepilin signal peptidase PulO-like enzyme (type II secretory pathway)